MSTYVPPPASFAATPASQRRHETEAIKHRRAEGERRARETRTRVRRAVGRLLRRDS